MKGRSVTRAAAAAAAAGVLSVALSGCFGPGGNWQIPSFMTQEVPAPATHRYPPTAAQSPPSTGGESTSTAPPAREHEHPAENTRTRHPANTVVPAAVATPAPPAQPSPKPSVTLADGPSKSRALRLLDNAGAKLAKVDRNTLSADSATTYDQANDFLKAGRKAATEEDYVAASGFADKAAVLAAKLLPASP